MPELLFDAGSLNLPDLPSLEGMPERAVACFQRDERTSSWRARACDYAEIVLSCRMSGYDLTDKARGFAPLKLEWKEPISLRPHQKKALSDWRVADHRGVVALPTGSGKTILAVSAIHALQRPTLITVPTIDLLVQWTKTLERFFGVEIGMLGGGEHKILPITVATYESAAIYMEFIGDKFAFLIADECHHLPGPALRAAASMSIAPYRLGLSATPDLPEDKMAVMTDLLGKIVCRVEIDELEGSFLAPYRVVSLRLPLDADEAERYAASRAIYTEFVRRNQISFATPDGWKKFLGLCACLPGGKAAFTAFLEQRRIARCGRAKIRELWSLFRRHVDDRIIIFTADNATAYTIGRTFSLPVLTCHTKAAERKEFLDKFRTGEYPILATSKVLNEGVDVPSATVGIVLSGSGSSREHIQRLGRILRPARGKAQAILYEIISANTGEEAVSARRRDNRAYRGR